MTYKELLETVRQYFGDTSRSAQQTKEDLEALADECHTMAETIPDDDGF